jgi:Icc-related predicted phosphoesterase
MRVHVVSDVHGRSDALASAGRGADALICLGDLLLFLDYADYGQGIFADLFGPDAARIYVELRTAGRFDEARELSARLLAEQDQSPARLFETAIARQYAELFGVLTEPAYLTYGNVDVPHMWQTYAKPGHHVLDGGTIDLDGWRFGFVGGGLKSAYRTPNEMTEEEFRPSSRRSARSTCCVPTSRPPFPSCCTTPWPGGWKRAAWPCWRRLRPLARGTRYSGTCISR